MAPPPSGSRKESRDRSAGQRAGGGGREQTAVYKGLCVNCAKRDTCLFPRSEGGVWHCGDYVEER